MLIGIWLGNSPVGLNISITRVTVPEEDAVRSTLPTRRWSKKAHAMICMNMMKVAQ